MKPEKKVKMPAAIPVRVVFFLALVGLAVGYVLWRGDKKDELATLILDFGLLLSLIAAILYPLFSSS
jgi:high-affinity Fe2+/Pb2+ permease